MADGTGLMLAGHVQLRGDRALDALADRGHGVAELGDLIATAQMDVMGQITLGHPGGQADGAGQRTGQAAADQHGGGDADHQRDRAQHQQLQQGPLAQPDRFGSGLAAFLFLVDHAIAERLVPAIGSGLHGAQGEGRGSGKIALLQLFAHLLVERTRHRAGGRDGVSDGLVFRLCGQGLVGGPAGFIARDQRGDARLILGQTVALADQHLPAHDHHLVVGIEHVREQPHLGHVDLDHLLHRALLYRTPGGAGGDDGRDQQQQQAKAHT